MAQTITQSLLCFLRCLQGENSSTLKYFLTEVTCFDDSFLLSTHSTPTKGKTRSRFHESSETSDILQCFKCLYFDIPISNNIMENRTVRRRLKTIRCSTSTSESNLPKINVSTEDFLFGSSFSNLFAHTDRLPLCKTEQSCLCIV